MPSACFARSFISASLLSRSTLICGRSVEKQGVAWQKSSSLLFKWKYRIIYFAQYVRRISVSEYIIISCKELNFLSFNWENSAYSVTRVLNIIQTIYLLWPKLYFMCHSLSDYNCFIRIVFFFLQVSMLMTL